LESFCSSGIDKQASAFRRFTFASYMELCTTRQDIQRGERLRGSSPSAFTFCSIDKAAKRSDWYFHLAFSFCDWVWTSHLSPDTLSSLLRSSNHCESGLFGPIRPASTRLVPGRASLGCINIISNWAGTLRITGRLAT
jgi:hypothetical protein